MNLALTRARLERELHRYEAALAAAAAHDPALAFGSTQALRAALCDRRPASFGVRDAITRAAIAQHRAHPHPLWPAVLTVAFFPMLASLRGRIATAAPAELDQALAVAFLESIERVALRTNMAARLRSATERAIFRAMGRERRRQARTVWVGSDDAPALSGHQDTEDAASLRITETPRRRSPASIAPARSVA